ncbi:YmfL family putative regulatory protein [Edwardsiella piscicida]|uniref:YmfL family putative regulatory protein n=1 Tax=Edwardsiella TaxID=635 RepID=UPI0002C0DA64|nr:MULTISPECIES: YmfL family putative regulatory protein [Edwardsiella]AGH74056.1 hypothetical protein ETAC_09675 [Edwardsiella piscicida C07-087]EKS7783476.1 hypothetical protein [Edwardsiella piscicida]UCQ23094.1 hypothetical protein DCE91_09845 [Edwardsiella piscicida]UCQ33301.1 hypothetical protein DCF34_09835 [Edwardsiella piscicida]WHQ15444.1 hypothetical protein MQ083_06660 [Edwardsiella anguillarum]
MVDIKTTIKAICRAYPGGQKAMAVQLGMTYDAFRNHLDQKCASRFFTLAEIERMEDVSGTSLLAEYHAARRGKLLVDIPVLEQIDNVELYEQSMRELVADGELAKAKVEAAADGVICGAEQQALMTLFWRKMRHHACGFFAFMALNGAAIADDSAVWVAHRECRPSAPAHNSCGD